jgi:hypothetical protein
MNKKSAFSLAEIAAVMIIISIILSGIVAGKRVLTKSKLTEARAITQTAGIGDMEDLLAWYETSMEDSFDYPQNSDATAVSLWHNRALKLEVRNDAVQSTSANQPIFLKKF